MAILISQLALGIPCLCIPRLKLQAGFYFGQHLFGFLELCTAVPLTVWQVL